MSAKSILIGKQRVRIEDTELGEYLCITDLAKLIHNNSGQVINNWIKSIRALEYMHVWETDNNPEYGFEAYKAIRMKAGSSSFFLSASQWIKRTKAIGIKSQPGRSGGTYAHHLIALEFCATLNAEFRLNVFKEYLELKQNQAERWLKTQEFYLRKMEDNALEINRFAIDMQNDIKKLKDKS